MWEFCIYDIVVQHAYSICSFIQQHINITDIVQESAPDHNGEKCKCVTIKFVPVLAENWRQEYEKRLSECNFIVNNDSESQWTTY